MKNTYRIGLAIVAVLLALSLSGCLPGPNQLTGTTGDSEKESAGFFMGLWHGLTLVVSAVASFFTKDVTIYEVHNSGTWYNLGYLLGIMIIFGGGGAGASRGRRSRRDD